MAGRLRFSLYLCVNTTDMFSGPQCGDGIDVYGRLDRLGDVTAAQRVDEFEALRPHLLAVGYRLTGTFADAEDAVQDAWLRWQGAAVEPDDLRAWLTTVVSRLALDRLRSAAHRRESYVGEWLPEPVVTDLGVADPLSEVVAHEDARYAAMVVLERLTPDQRVAFVLHDGFGVPFSEIASVLLRRTRRRGSWRPGRVGSSASTRARSVPGTTRWSVACWRRWPPATWTR